MGAPSWVGCSTSNPVNGHGRVAGEDGSSAWALSLRRHGKSSWLLGSIWPSHSSCGYLEAWTSKQEISSVTRTLKTKTNENKQTNKQKYLQGLSGVKWLWLPQYYREREEVGGVSIVMQSVKLPLTCQFHFWHSSLWMHLQDVGKWPKYLGLCNLIGDLSGSSRLLALAWRNSGSCKHLS